MKKNKSDKACILTGKTVTGIATEEDGIEVLCGDGTTFHGSIVIGADGVNSKVRQSMRELAEKASAPDVNEEKPYLSEYKVLWCTFPRQPCNEPGDTIEIHGKDLSLQCLNSQKRSWLFIYERLEFPTRERVSYSQEDAKGFAERHGNVAIGEHLKVNDVFPKRYTAGMSNLEEGIVKHWSWNRVVLVGDACHKFTPNQGLGYNNGIQDVVALVNELNHAVSPEHRSGREAVSLESLIGVFSQYQASRMKLLRNDLGFSASWTRVSAWRNSIYHLMDRYVLPAIPKMDEFATTHLVSGHVSRTLVLDFVESEEPFQGSVPWKHAMKTPQSKVSPRFG
ncbi:putative fad binding domain-containing protein [Diaporthe ampelina]|uniref:Putative fad binding domain-containing protein n=1 Tax=Diaporthe ampelina TaxID=1214573 RepID=A0A0G2HYD9_9PEZI|nr:putative fad binding domain-containing protein [Diaporthe ampelina]